MNKMFYIHILYRLKLLIFMVCVVTSGFPLQEPQFKDETHFPNGSVIGKYTYLDKDGNPIFVRYYADDASYGVELQSKKIMVGSNADDSLLQHKNDIMKTLENHLDAPDSLELPNLPKYNTTGIDDITNNKPINSKKVAKPKIEYEVFYQNNVQSPKRCGKDKVKIYLNKQKRISRDTMQHQADQYCEQLY